LLIAGDQLPEMPLVEVVGNAANGSPLQIDATALNAGTVLAGFTPMVIVAVVAHWPAVGVKV